MAANSASPVFVAKNGAGLVGAGLPSRTPSDVLTSQSASRITW